MKTFFKHSWWFSIKKPLEAFREKILKRSQEYLIHIPGGKLRSIFAGVSVEIIVAIPERIPKKVTWEIFEKIFSNPRRNFLKNPWSLVRKHLKGIQEGIVAPISEKIQVGFPGGIFEGIPGLFLKKYFDVFLEKNSNCFWRMPKYFWY